MNKLLILLMILSAFLMLNATTLEVSLDGSHPYTSIQDAIDDTIIGDTVLVHPGRYLENLSIYGKSISMCSEFNNNRDWNVVESTIIDGNLQARCLLIDSYSAVILNGLTFTNGTRRPNFHPYHGGGLSINGSSTVSLSNCIIDNNESEMGGGVSCSDNSSLTLSGNIIRANRAFDRGGGISISESSVLFDPTNLNSIFDNYGSVLDISISNSSCSDIILDTLSVVLSEPDGYFISYNSIDNIEDPFVSVQNGKLNLIDSDLYVSPSGNDNNDGLTPSTALKTIAYATKIIQPNEVNPRQILLLPGTYSRDVNNQIFPIALKSNTKLIGSSNSPHEVILGGWIDTSTIQLSFGENIEIGHFFISSNYEIISPIGMYQCSNISVHDIEFRCSESVFLGVWASHINYLNISNCSITDVVANRNMFGHYIGRCSNVSLNNIVINNVTGLTDVGFQYGIDMSASSVTANNIIISNTHFRNLAIATSNFESEFYTEIGSLQLTNLIMYDNISTSDMPLINLTNWGSQNYLNNMTVYNNDLAAEMIRVVGDYTVKNCVLYNPEASYEIKMWEPYDFEIDPQYSDLHLDYNLVRDGNQGIGGTDEPNNTLTWGSHNIDADPMFRGDVIGDVPLGDYRWLQLTENSPCVNAGTPDTLGMNLPTVDIAGNPRVWDDIIDMGAYEYNPTPNSDETAPSPPATIQVSHFPNPVTPNGSNGKVAFIEFTLPKKPIEKPTLEIFNIKGQKVRDLKITQSFSQLVRSAGLSSEDKQTGEHYSKIWDCKDNNLKTVASGIYFYKVSCEGEEAIGRMMVVK